MKKPCCQNQRNLKARVHYTNRFGWLKFWKSPDLVVNTCVVCGCRHFELTINPGVLGVVGKETAGG